MTLHCEVTTDKYLVGLLKISYSNHYERLQVTTLIAMTLHCEVTTDKYLVSLLKISYSNHYEQLQVTKPYIS